MALARRWATPLKRQSHNYLLSLNIEKANLVAGCDVRPDAGGSNLVAVVGAEFIRTCISGSRVGHLKGRRFAFFGAERECRRWRRKLLELAGCKNSAKSRNSVVLIVEIAVARQEVVVWHAIAVEIVGCRIQVDCWQCSSTEHVCGKLLAMEMSVLENVHWISRTLLLARLG